MSAITIFVIVRAIARILYPNVINNFQGTKLLAQVDAYNISTSFYFGLLLNGGFVGVGSYDFGYSDWDDLYIYDEADMPTTTTRRTTTRRTTTHTTQHKTTPTPKTSPSSQSAQSTTADQQATTSSASYRTSEKSKILTVLTILASMLLTKL